MSTTTDTRVVEMRFDNKQFESNAQETLKTLDQLKKALNDNLSSHTFDNLDRAAKNVDFSAIESGIQSLSDRFSTFGIVGMRVIENITDALTNKLASTFNAVIGQITSGGLKRAENIENARFQLQGLIDDQSEVNAIMQDAADSVDGTAYAYDSAAKAASMFAATGLRSGEEMQSALKAIAGVAATTNSDYESMSQIFTTISGQGKVMSDQLNQLANRGMNAAAALTTYFNGVKEGSIDATDHVKQLLVAIGATGEGLAGVTASGADIEGISEDYIKAFQKAQKKELKAKQKAYNEEYNALKKSLDEQYNLKKKELDRQYKELAASLDAEIKEVQKANQEATKEVQERYQAEITAAREATNEKIRLINEEYIENLKLIDEERYNKIKAIDDQIEAINKQAEAEEKARKKKERDDKLAAFEEAINNAQTISYREKLQEELAKYREELNKEDLEEQRKEQVKNLEEQKKLINEEYDEKKEAERKAREEKVEDAQEEGNETVKRLQEQYEQELNALKESQEKQMEALRDARSEKLEALRESQQNELSTIREGHSEQLGELKERQQEELELFRETQSDKLEELKDSMGKTMKELKEYIKGTDLTEAAIREMVTNGMIDFETFSEAMATTFGDHAKDANKTFSGAMANIRAALSRTGAMFFSPFLTQEGQMVGLFNAIRVKINEFNNALSPLAKIITDEILTVIPNITRAVKDLDLSFKQVVTSANGSTKEINILQVIAQTIGNTFRGLVMVFRNVAEYIKPIFQAFHDMFKLDWQVLEKGSENFRTMARELKPNEELIKAIYDLFTGLFSVVKSVWFVFKSLLDILSPLGKLFGVTSDNVSSLFENIGKTISAFSNWLQTSKEVQNVISTLTHYVDLFANKLKILADIIKASFRNSFGGFDLGKYFTEGFLNGMTSLIPDVLRAIWNFGKELLTRLRVCLKIKSPSEETYYDGVFTMQGYLDGITGMAKTVIDGVVTVFKSIILAIRNYISSINWSELIMSMSDFVVNFINTFTEGVNHGIDVAFDAIKNFFRTIAAYIAGEELPEDEQSAGWKFVVSFIHGMGNAIKAIGSSLKSIAETLWNNFYSFIKDVSLKDAARMALDFIRTFASTFIDKIKEWSGPVGDALADFFGGIDNGSLTVMLAGVGIIWAVTKAIKALTAWTTPLQGLNSVLFAFKNTLRAVAFDVSASAILKIAAAVALMAGAIALLTATFMQADNPQTIGAAIAAVAVVGLLLVAVAAIAAKANDMDKEVKSINSAFDQLARGVKNLSHYLGIKIIIDTIVSDLGQIVFTIAAFAALYDSNSTAMDAAMEKISVIAGVLTGIIGVMALLAALLGKENADSFKAVTTGFLAFAAGIVVVLLAIHDILGMKLDKADYKALGVLAGIIILFGLIVGKIVDAIAGMPKAGGIGIGTILALCILLMAVILALKKLINEGITLKNSWRQLAVIGVILLAITLLSALVVDAGSSTEKSLHFGSTLLAFPVLLIACILALKPLSEMDNDAYLNGLWKLAGIFGAMLIVCAAANKLASGNAGNNAFKSILAIGLMAGILAIAIGALSMIDESKGWTAVKMISVVLIALAVALAAAGTLAKASDKTYGSIFIMLLIIAAIGGIMILLCDKPWESMISIGGSIALVVLAMAGALKLMSEVKVEGRTFVYFFLGLVAALVLGYFMQYLAADDWKGALAVGAAISLVILAMGAAIRLMGDSKNSVSVEDIAGFFFGLIAAVLVGAVIGKLAEQPWDQMLALGAAISLVLLAMGEAVKLMGDSKNSVSGKDIGAFFVGLIGIAIVAAVIGMLAQQPWDQMLALGASISMVLLACGACVAILGLAGDVSLTAIGAFALALVGAIGIAFILVEFGNQVTNVDALIPFAISIAITLIACAVICGLCAIIGPVAGEALIGIGVLDLFIADLVLVMEALAHLTDAKALEDGGQKLGLVGEAIGKFIGGIVEGFAEEMLKLLPKIGEALSEFVVSCNPFFTALKEMGDNPGMVKAAEAMAGMLLALGAAELMTAVSNIFSWMTGTSSLGTLGSQLASFGHYINSFNVNTKDIQNPYHLKTVAEAASYLINMAKDVPNEGGWLGSIMGENSVDWFGYRLWIFSTWMPKIAANFAQVKDLKRFDEVAKGMESIIRMATTLPNEGGWMGAVLGENTIDWFGYRLYIFSSWLPKIANYFSQVKDLSRFDAVADSMKKIVEMACSLPNSGGWLGKLVGNNDIDSFGQKLVSFSGSVKQVAANFEGVNLDLVEQAADSMRTMVFVAKTIKENALGGDGLFSKDNSLINFGKNLVEFSKSIKEVTGNLTSIDNFYRLSDALEKFAKLKDGLTGFKADDLIKFLQTLETTGADSIKKFLEAFSDPQSTNILNSVTTLFNKLKTEIVNPSRLNQIQLAGNQIVSSLFKGLTDGMAVKMYAESAKAIVSFIITALNSALSMTKMQFQIIGSTIVSEIMSGFSGAQSAILYKMAIMSMLTSITAEATSATAKNLIKLASTSIISNFTAGLSDSISLSRIKIATTLLITSLASNLSSGISKVTITATGNSVVDTFANALTDGISLSKVKLAALSIITSISGELYSNMSKSLFTLTGNSLINVFASSLYDPASMSKIKLSVSQFIVKLTSELIAANNTLMITKAGEVAANAFGTAIHDKTSESMIASHINKLINYCVDALEEKNAGLVGGQFGGKFGLAGEYDAMKFATGLSVTRTIEILIGNFIINVYNQFMKNENMRLFEEAGKNAAYGFARGLGNSEARRSVEDAAKEIARAAYDNAKNELAIQSPSKKMAELGSFAGEGFVIGFTEWVSAAGMAGEEIGESAKEGLNNAIEKIASEIQNDEQFNPTITPVLDLSELEQNAGQISEMLNLDKPIELASDAGISFSGGVNDLLGNIQASMPDGSNADVVEAINQMRSDMAKMSDAIRQMQIVMDTGELVGAITDPIDAQMGFNSILVERGVRV